MRYKNWAWGLFFLLAAVLIIGVQLGYVPGLSTWRMILAVLLGAMALQSLVYLEFFGVFVPMAVIGILFDRALGIEALTPWPILAAAVCMSIGFHILFRNAVKKRRSHYHHKHSYSHSHSYNRASEPHGPEHKGGGDGAQSADKAYGTEQSGANGHGGHKEYRGEASETIVDDYLECEVTFGAGIKYMHSQNLRHARFECSFGSLKVYFDQAKLSPEGAYVDVECSFASVELFVPRGWLVVDKITPTLGRVKNNFNTPPEQANALTLTGSVQFGSVEIVYI